MYDVNQHESEDHVLIYKPFYPGSATSAADVACDIAPVAKQVTASSLLLNGEFIILHTVSVCTRVLNTSTVANQEQSSFAEK